MTELNKNKQYIQRQEIKEVQGKSNIKIKRIKHTVKAIIIAILIILSIGGLILYATTRQPIAEDEIVSRKGFHWHPELIIYVKGKKQEIPPNIGIGAVHKPIHTHNDNEQGIIHFEFQGLVRKQDITLGQFFKNWNKDIRSFGANMKMIVNGQENTDYENYIVQENDKIELWYE